MTLRDEKGFSYWLDNFVFNVKKHVIESDIQSIKDGLSILNKGGVSAFIYRAEMNTSYSKQENIKIMKLLLKQKREELTLKEKHRSQLKTLNSKLRECKVNYEK